MACTGNSGLYAEGTVRTLGTLVSGASLTYTTLDADDLTLVLTMATTPPSTTRIRGIRSNPAATLPPPPVVASKSAIRLLTTTEALQYTTIGSQITFNTVVLNAGTTVLTAVGISDAVADAGSISCDSAELTPGATTDCSFTHTIAQADVDNGSVVSLTTGTGTPPSGSPVTNVSGTVTVPGVQAAQLTVTKSTTATNYKLAGEVLDYSATVRNTGNVTLNSLNLTDPKSDGTISCSPTALAPLDTATCTYQYTVKASELVVGGTIASAATATASKVSGGNVSATSNSVSVPFLASPAITGTMVADRSSFNLPGQVITYTTTVTNTGNVSLSSIAVSHTNATSPSCTATTLAAGASTTCTARHVVTLADTLALSVRNRGTVSGVPASGGGAITASTNEVVVAVVDGIALTVTKVHNASLSVYRQVGEVLQYTITVRNTGTLALANLTVTDPMNDGSSTVCSFTTVVAVDAQRTCTAQHTVTAAELGSPIVNTARARAQNVLGLLTVTVDSNDVTVNFLPTPQLAVTMTSNPTPTFTTLGAAINYTMTVTNTGNVPLTGVGVTDQTLGGASTPNCAASTLAVGASTTCTSSYTTTTSDAAGSVSNRATVSGTYASTPVTALSSTVTVNSTVPCSVTGITASPTTVGRQANGRLNNPVVVSVATTGVCSGIRILYYPSTSKPGVIDTLSGSASTWTYTIPTSGSKASKWDAGPAQVDVLPATGSTTINTTDFYPFAVT